MRGEVEGRHHRPHNNKDEDGNNKRKDHDHDVEDLRGGHHRHHHHHHDKQHKRQKIQEGDKEQVQSSTHDVESTPHWDDLDVFDIYSVPVNLSGIIYGARGSGKTSWVTWFIFFHQFDYSDVYILSSTAFTGHYQTFLPNHYVFHEYREDVLEMVIEHQKKNRQNHVLFVLDDVLDSIADIRKSRALHTLFTMGRHLNIAVIVCSQYALALVPAFRRNCDIAVVFGAHSVDTFDQLYKEYGHHLSRNEFQHLCERYCMTPYFSCLVVLPTVRSHNIKVIYKFSIAEQEDVRPFFIGKEKKEGEKEEEQSQPQHPPVEQFSES